MLGRLFKQQQSPLPSPLNPPSHSQIAPKSSPCTSNSYDDSYTREILYGSSSSSQIRPHVFSRRGFRLVVAQDGGNLRSKQVLFDSADRDSAAGSVSGSVSHSEAPSPSRPRSQSEFRSGVQSATVSSPASPRAEDVTLTQSLSQLQFSSGSSPKNILSSKLFHNVSELNEYMFGRGLPSSESHTATKVHLLPQFNSVHGSFSAVLVTRLFSIPDAGSIVAESPAETDPSWTPEPAYPIKEISYAFPSSLSTQQPCSPDLGSSMPSKYSVNSRFSIGIVIPYSSEQSVDEVVLQNWEVISQYLISLQKLVTKKLLAVISFSTVNGVCPYLANRRVSFPSELLQADADLPRQLQKLYRLIHFNYNTPRLINSNSIMKYSASHTNSRLKAMLVNWVLEVINWLEFKDGRNISSSHPNFASNAHFHNNLHAHHNTNHELEGTPSNTFLASLFALVLSVRDSLSQAPPTKSDPKARKELTRVLIVTGNSMVAKRLIFILNGLIPDTQFETCIDDDDYKRSLQYINNNDTTDNEMRASFSSQETFYNHSHSAADRSKRVTTPLPDPAASPIPETMAQDRYPAPEVGSINVVQPIPIRKGRIASDNMGASSDDSLSVSVSSQKGWEVPGKAIPAASVSLVEKPIIENPGHYTAQYNPVHGKPSMSTSSSMAQLSSSLNSSLSSSASNYSFSKLGSSFLDKWRNSFASGPIHSQDYHHEGFENYQAVDLNKRPSYHSLNSHSPAIEQDDFQWDAATTATARGRSRLSRAQSMLDLYNHTSSPNGHPQNSTDFPAINIKRSRTAAVVPLASDRASGLFELSNDIIKRKCKHISEARISSRAFDGNTLEIKVIPSDEEKIYKHKPLLPNVAFVEEFRPEFTMQSCPISSKLEAQVSASMKNDLLFYSDCGFRQVLVRTVVVSLRAREIKVIEMNLGEKNEKTPSASYSSSWVAPAPSFMQGMTTPPVIYHSPPTSYFNHQSESGLNSPSHNHLYGQAGNPSDSRSYKTTIRKVFMPHRNSGDRDQITKIESLLDHLTELVGKINISCQEQAPEDRMKQLSSELLDTVRFLIQ